MVGRFDSGSAVTPSSRAIKRVPPQQGAQASIGPDFMDAQLEQQLGTIVRKVQSYHPDPDLEMLRKAFDLAHEMHKDQHRRSGEVYLTHPLSVTEIIADLKLDIPCLCAGILHDIVEDTDISVGQLHEQFNPEIAFIVDGVTKLSKFAFTTREERQAESFRKMLIAMSSDLRVILVKLADRLHNMRTLRFMPEEKQRYIARETLDIYAPLAHRLGIYWIKSELEDLAFRHLHAEDYYRLADKVAKKKNERERYIQETITILEEGLGEHKIAARVTGRPKHFYSIWRKMRNNSIPFEQVFDVLAFRVITGTVTQCYEILGLVHSLWKPVPGRFKDYVAMPKPNGYQSLHTSVIGPYHERVEIQIRTEDMHKVAEEGVAAHWSYKEGRVTPSNEAGQFAWLRQLVEWQQDLADPKEFMDTVKVDLFPEEVYALTPRGDVKVLRKGSTPIDFAYSIHTEVGHHCVGARVNGSIVPLRYEINNGDMVEIMTSPHARPSKDWLKTTKTSRARNKIHHYIRAEERERSREYGQELLDKEFKRYKLNLRKLIRTGELLRVAQACKFQSVHELMLNLGFGRIQPETVVKKLVPDAEPNKVEPTEGVVDKVMRVLTRKRPGIALDGIEDIMVHYARCCSPVRGEAIVGFVTRGRGLSIHTADCPGLDSLEKERLIDVYWNDEEKQTTRPVSIRVLCTNAPGLLANISQAFTEAGVNIAEAHCRTTGERAVNTFEVHVSGLSQLNKALSAIRNIDGVNEVQRIRA